MNNEDVLRIINSIRNNTIVQLESAIDFYLVFHEKETNSIISIDKTCYKEITGFFFRYKENDYIIEQEPYLMYGLKFYKFDNGPLPF